MINLHLQVTYYEYSNNFHSFYKFSLLGSFGANEWNQYITGKVTISALPNSAAPAPPPREFPIQVRTNFRKNSLKKFQLKQDFKALHSMSKAKM